MFKKMISLLAVTMFALTAYSQKVLVSDGAHSRIQFTIIHLGISDITGSFDKAEMTIAANDKNFTDSQIAFNADVNSINTHIEARDTHLKSADFFDAATYPKMDFVSTTIEQGKANNYYTLNGNLTMHGVTKPVSLTLIYRGSVVDKKSKKETFAYQVMGTVKRSDFAIGGKFPEAMLSDMVRIKGDFELKQK